MSKTILRISLGGYTILMETMVPVSLKMPKALRDQMLRVAESREESEGQFIRVAVADRLRGLGEQVSDATLRRPSRKGVGGRPTHRAGGPPKPPRPTRLPFDLAPAAYSPLVANDAPPVSPKPADAAAKAALDNPEALADVLLAEELAKLRKAKGSAASGPPIAKPRSAPKGGGSPG